MTDLKTLPNHPYLEEEELRQTIEMLFFAYRDFTKEPDKMLERIGLGRAHHRAVYFIGRNPATTVTGLLDILKIRKQSLSRVLNQLILEFYVYQEVSQDDRRKKLLYLTKKGIELERSLTSNQRKRIAKAYDGHDAQAIDGFKNILTAIINEIDQSRFAKPLLERKQRLKAVSDIIDGKFK